MKTDMVTEIVAICTTLRRQGNTNVNTRDSLASVFECEPNAPTFFHILAALIAQFDMLRSQISDCKQLSEDLKKDAVRELDAIAVFLHPERLIRPWSEVLQSAFHQQHFGFRYLQPAIAREFPINSLSTEDVDDLLSKTSAAISEIVGEDAPPIVARTLSNALAAVAEVLKHFRFYGTSVLEEKMATVYMQASALDAGSAGEGAKSIARKAFKVIGLIALALINSDEAIHAVEDWGDRSNAAIHFLASHGSSEIKLLSAPEAIRPEEPRLDVPESERPCE
jgi:hypothetical protein